MKYLLLMLLGIGIISCTNQKAKIVEQIKQHKDSLIVAEMNISGYQYAAKHILANQLTQVDEKFLKEQGYNSTLTYGSLDSMRQIWWTKSLEPRNKIDSLELELKKY